MTETFPFAITYSNGVYELSQPTNDNLVICAGIGDILFITDPGTPEFYWFGNRGYAVTLDYTLCTNLTTDSRKAQMEAAIALAG